MLYFGIDQHARQITISLRDDQGDVLQARQVSTQPEKIQAFFDKLTRDCVQRGESFIAVLEVCGFNDWLIRLLQDCRYHAVFSRHRSPCAEPLKNDQTSSPIQRDPVPNSATIGQVLDRLFLRNSICQ